MKGRPHDEAMAEQFHTGLACVTELLIEVPRNGDLAELAVLLRQITKAFEWDEGGAADADRKLSSA